MATAQTQERRRSSARTAKPSTEVSRRRPIRDVQGAVERVLRRDAVVVGMPVLGEVRLPSREDAVFLGGIAALAAFGILEWPVAVVLGVGHELAMNRHSQLLRSFGAALEEA
jgi:hypothetical protein